MRRNAIATGTDPGRRVGRSGARRGPNILSDGACETGADWTGITGTISVSTASPHGGTGAVRLTSTSTNGRAHTAAILTVGKRYRLTGWYRGNGTVPAMFYNLSATPDPTLTQSTTSTSWQPLDTTFTAGDTILRIYAVGASGNWVEIDDLYLSLES